MSLAIQTYKDYKVTIVNDCSDKDYSDLINHYSKYFKIDEIILDKNLGPGTTRRIGMENTNSPYILFIDSDDILYSPYSLYKLMDNVSDEYDIIISNFIKERDNKREVIKKDNIWLHCKLYYRDYLNKNNITFNDTRSNEDNGFNRLIILHKPRILYLDGITYLYAENSNSITRKNNREYKYIGLDGYVYNMLWAIDNIENKNINLDYALYTLEMVLVTMYFYYLELYKDYDVSKIINLSKDIYDKYIKYVDIYDKDGDILDKIYKAKEKEYKDIDKVISFTEFIKEVSL
jgi:glycosyltransferase involved in cell wall biosynthesis